MIDHLDEDPHYDDIKNTAQQGCPGKTEAVVPPSLRQDFGVAAVVHDIERTGEDTLKLKGDLADPELIQEL